MCPENMKFAPSTFMTWGASKWTEDLPTWPSSASQFCASNLIFE